MKLVRVSIHPYLFENFESDSSSLCAMCHHNEFRVHFSEHAIAKSEAVYYPCPPSSFVIPTSHDSRSAKSHITDFLLYYW
ncbi:hypothetical protein VNO77_21487 [Canavalia gladiata]|uniref:Uncharacterized protein n=1 Tax=Canavalia gladiata TaxID=3824 RepID=A0AAN9QM57_CANGL